MVVLWGWGYVLRVWVFGGLGCVFVRFKCGVGGWCVECYVLGVCFVVWRGLPGCGGKVSGRCLVGVGNWGSTWCAGEVVSVRDAWWCGVLGMQECSTRTPCSV